MIEQASFISSRPKKIMPMPMIAIAQYRKPIAFGEQR